MQTELVCAHHRTKKDLVRHREPLLPGGVRGGGRGGGGGGAQTKGAGDCTFCLYKEQIWMDSRPGKSTLALDGHLDKRRGVRAETKNNAGEDGGWFVITQKISRNTDEKKDADVGGRPDITPAPEREETNPETKGHQGAKIGNMPNKGLAHVGAQKGREGQDPLAWGGKKKETSKKTKERVRKAVYSIRRPPPVPWRAEGGRENDWRFGK